MTLFGRRRRAVWQPTSASIVRGKPGSAMLVGALVVGGLAIQRVPVLADPRPPAAGGEVRRADSSVTQESPGCQVSGRTGIPG